MPSAEHAERTEPTATDHGSEAAAAGGAALTVLALDIGGTKITAARVRIAPDRSRAEVLEEATVPTPAREGARAVLEAALDAASHVTGDPSGSGSRTGGVSRTGVASRAGAADDRLSAVGISTAGVVDVARGEITHATSSLPGWPGTRVAAAFTERFALPARALNDVHAHGLGEALFGTGRDASSLLLVAVGTGIGGAQVVDGRPVVGVRGAAGHVGHVTVPEAASVPCTCGRVGHLEGLASGPGILDLARRLGANAAQCADGPALATAARAADGPAREAYRLAGLATGRVIGSLLNVLDAETVALAGGVVGASEVWDDALRQGVAREAMDVVAATPVVRARAGSRAALLGAAAWAIS
ncbi:ROK family protein [Brachybacterium sp. MASK1Z-5]|uniref:ROK family protein n=1 Tax=Brachybacterium halotolerans TaxID=2795215 RepID=A0ABS1B913_9MICO|nr:ROK family protein [Brachybacterium halotolerans]MBK0331094.1 ROK family protein [Brachybacterium halotolerans]